MSVVYILAHFDDEYCALPMIWQATREGLAQRFIYLADYRDAALGRRRLAETCGFLARQGIAATKVVPLGLGTGVYDQSLHHGVDRLLPGLVQTLADIGPVTRLVVPAWEGGHMDHDACAFLAVRLAERLGGPEVRQFTLYNGPGLPGPLLRGGAPLKENGRRQTITLTPGEWLGWMAGVRAFPSQLYAWSGIWPAEITQTQASGASHPQSSPTSPKPNPPAPRPGRVEAR
jgi:LmbE family N-acetylglucosaminyl deacetylase